MSRQPYLTLNTLIELEIEPVKGSRFIGYLFPIQSDADVKAKVAELWAKHPHARHCCSALQTHDHARGDDDGEPKGSAGKPILAQIQGAELYNVGIVVVRYFGGTKLGVGGLVRAYGSCAGEVIKHAKEHDLLITVTPKTAIIMTYRYDDTSAVNTVLAQFDVSASEAEYGCDICQTVWIEDDCVEPFKLALIERSAGRVQVRIAD